MPAAAPDLHRHLAAADLLLFKGDLNYRKLLGDRMWPAHTPFATALCGFAPAPLLALRTLKSETLAGVAASRVEAAQAADPAWNVNGSTAVIQFFDSAE